MISMLLQVFMRVHFFIALAVIAVASKCLLTNYYVRVYVYML